MINKKYTYTWWQIGLFKLSMLSFGVCIGAYWQEIFSGYLTSILVLGIILGIYIMSVSLRQGK